nr:serine/threonine protein kinase [Tanacetum cinerariifolium]
MNTEGSYDCTCKPGYSGNAKTQDGCRPDAKGSKFPVMIFTLGCGRKIDKNKDNKGSNSNVLLVKISVPATENKRIDAGTNEQVFGVTLNEDIGVEQFSYQFGVLCRKNSSGKKYNPDHMDTLLNNDGIVTEEKLVLLRDNVKPLNTYCDMSCNAGAYYNGEPSKKIANFRTLLAPASNEAHVVVPKRLVLEVKQIFENTVYGFFKWARKLSIAPSKISKNLATYFVKAMKENRLFEIVEPRLLREGTLEQLQAVGDLVKGCLNIYGNDRPTMKEVAMELEVLKKFKTHP